MVIVEAFCRRSAKGSARRCQVLGVHASMQNTKAKTGPSGTARPRTPRALPV
jgi:hypothetical protein